MPPGQHVGIDLLVDNPLFAHVGKAKITGLSPGRQMENHVVLIVGKRLEGGSLREIGLFGGRCDYFRAVLSQPDLQIAPDISGASRHENFLSGVKVIQRHS